MSAAARTLGFLLAILATIGFLFTTIYREWKRNSVVASQANFLQIYSSEGLWVRCNSPQPGQFQCDEYDTALLGVPPQLQGMRAMMCISTLSSVIAVIVGLMGLPCIVALEGNKKLLASRAAGLLEIIAADLQAQRAMMCLATIAAVGGLVCGALGLQCMKVMEGNAKKWSGRGGGFLMMLAGALCLGAVSWYAADVVRDFWNPLNQTNSFKYEFGSALYVGWISSGVALISGALMACCTCGGNEDDQDDYRYAYKPPSKPSGQQRNTEYV